MSELAGGLLGLVFVGGFVSSHVLRDQTTGLGRASVLLAGASMAALWLYVAGAVLFVWPLAVLIVAGVGWRSVKTFQVLRWMDQVGEPRAAVADGRPVHASLLSASPSEQGIAQPNLAASRCRLCLLEVLVPGRDEPIELERPLHPRLVRRLRDVGLPAPIELRVRGDEVAVDWAATRAEWFELDPITSRIAPT